MSDDTTTCKVVPTTDYAIGKPYLKREVGYSGQVEYRQIVLSAIIPELGQALYYGIQSNYAQPEARAVEELTSAGYLAVSLKDLYTGVAITRGDKLNEI
jgi:hypothetical protein